MGDAFAGPNKWVFIRLFWLEGTVMFVIISLIFLPPLFNIIFIPSWIPCGAIINLSVPTYLKMKHQRVAYGKEFHECPIRFGLLSKPEDFLLGFTNIVEITPDWTDERLKRFQNSREFIIGLQNYITRVVIQDFHAKRLGVEEMRGLIKNIKALPSKSEQQTQLQKVIKSTQEMQKKMEDNAIQAKKDIKQAKKEEQKKKSKNPTEYQLKDLPFSYLSIDDINLNKEALKKCHIYIGLLYEEEFREGHTIPFDRVVIITEQPKEIILETRSMDAEDKHAYPIDIKGVRCYYLCVRWILDQIPILYLRWSENMVTQDLMSIKSPEMDYLNIKVLEEIVFHKSDDNRQAALKIDRLEALYEGAREELSDTVQDIWEYRHWGFGNRLGDQRAVLQAKAKVTKWKTLTVAIIVIFTFLFAFMFLFNLNLGSMPIPSPGG